MDFFYTLVFCWSPAAAVSFTCPLVKNNKANWNSDSQVTLKQVGACYRSRTLFNQILRPFWVPTFPHNSCRSMATGAATEPRAAGSRSPPASPSSPTSESQCWARLSLSPPRGPCSSVNHCYRSGFRASTTAWAMSGAGDWERTHHPHAYTVKKLWEEDMSPSGLTHKAALTKS